MVRVSEESPFVKMPFIASPEEDFEFDAETGTITEYLGSDVDVVIPRTIGGVEVKTIGYGTFACAEDYTDTSMESDQTEWLHLRSVVIPETVTAIEDSTFQYCQQLETVVCYGPLESSGKGVFSICRSLKHVIFVNGLKMIDNYFFEGCQSLTNVWYKGKLDFVGVAAFFECAVESLTIDAKEICDEAFRRCTSLQEIHILDGVESCSVGAFPECSSLKRICFEFTNADALFVNDTYSGVCVPDTVLVIPTATSEEDAAQFYKMLKASELGPIADEAHVVREDCTTTAAEMPDVVEMMSAYGRYVNKGNNRVFQPEIFSG